MSESLREQIIQALLATRAMSEGVVADAIIATLSQQEAEVVYQYRIVSREGMVNGWHDISEASYKKHAENPLYEYRTVYLHPPKHPPLPKPDVSAIRELLGHVSDVMTDAEFDKINVAKWNAVSSIVGNTEVAEKLPPQPASVPQPNEYNRGVNDVREEIKQLCKDFSDLQNRPYMGDVHSAIDSLLDRLIIEQPVGSVVLSIKDAQMLHLNIIDQIRAGDSSSSNMNRLASSNNALGRAIAASQEGV